MNKRNYQKELDDLLKRGENLKGGKPKKLLLHTCCGPCSSYCLEYLSEYFEITVFYYNPNIYPPEEYQMRVKEQERFIGECDFHYPVHFVAGNYDPDRFYETVKGLEHLGECSERCYECYGLRLKEAAAMALEGGFDYFTTSLSISPMKNAVWLNEIGEKFAGEYGVAYLPSDFKKKNGYLRSCEISREHGMYRQDYCGCVFSLKERDERNANREKQAAQ